MDNSSTKQALREGQGSLEEKREFAAEMKKDLMERVMWVRGFKDEHESFR